MEVILLENIQNLGPFGAKVKVANGYGRNYLIPQGKALPANGMNIARFEAQRAELEKKADDRLTDAKSQAESFAALSVTLEARASEEGKLYGSIGTTEIMDAVSAQNLSVERRQIRLPEGGIHAIGEYEVTLCFHADVEITVPVIVEGMKRQN